MKACCGGEDATPVLFQSEYPVPVDLPILMFYSEVGKSLDLRFEASSIEPIADNQCSSSNFCGWQFKYFAQSVEPQIVSPLPELVLYDDGPSTLEFDNSFINSGICAPSDPLEGSSQGGCQEGIDQIFIRYTNGSDVAWLQLQMDDDSQLFSWSIVPTQLPLGPTKLELDLHIQNEYHYSTRSPFNVTILSPLSSLVTTLACTSYSFEEISTFSESINCNVTFSEPVVRSVFILRVEGVSLDIYDFDPTYGVDLKRVFHFMVTPRVEESGISTVSVVAQNCDVLDAINITSLAMEDATSSVTCAQTYVDIDEGTSVPCTLLTANSDVRVAVPYPFGFLAPDPPVAHYGTSWDFENAANGPCCSCKCRPAVDTVWWDDKYTCGECLDTSNCGINCNRDQVLFIIHLISQHARLSAPFCF